SFLDGGPGGLYSTGHTTTETGLIVHRRDRSHAGRPAVASQHRVPPATKRSACPRLAETGLRPSARRPAPSLARQPALGGPGAPPAPRGRSHARPARPVRRPVPHRPPTSPAPPVTACRASPPGPCPPSLLAGPPHER